MTVSAASPQRYCSRACYRRSSAETLLEATIRRELEDSGVPFRQEVQLGIYVIDFVIDNQLAIEADGEYWHQSPAVKARDAVKAAAIKAAGMKVVRIKEQGMGVDAKLSINRQLVAALASLLWPKPLMLLV